MTIGADEGEAALLPPLLLVGCGKMGSALLAGWIKNGLAPSVVVDPAARDPGGQHLLVESLDALPVGFSPGAVVIAVKPQIAGSVLAGLGERFAASLFVSIMAGRTIASMRREAKAPTWVRAMPNLPASIGRGVTAAFASPEVTRPQVRLVDRMLGAVGQVAWLEDEAMLDAVTAVSGSGPAYVFLLAEALEQAATKAGLPVDIARLLARETVAGAGALLATGSGDARAMREAVTSKAGTTERALSVLMRAGGLIDLIDEAVAKAADRSRELAS